MSDEPPFACLHAWVEGRVQGVGFRYFVHDHALRLGLSGWVRNVGEEQVEVWAEGRQTHLDELLRLLHDGPPSAYVSEVRVEPETPRGKYLRFQIAPSSY
jgi:acylphosphatase